MVDDFAVQGTCYRVPQMRLAHVHGLYAVPACQMKHDAKLASRYSTLNSAHKATYL